LLILGAVANVPDAVYFALATYTTVGYGDVVLASEHRVFGAMAAVTGMLVFGLSTAFLVAILTRHFPSARFH
jgi:Ion channel